MGKLRVHNIEAQTGTNVDLGAAGDVVTLASDSIQTNLYKDSGGNTIFQSDGAGTLSNVNSGLSAAGPKLILSQTASGSSEISFTSGIDSTYDKYMFVYLNVASATNNVQFYGNGSTDGGSTYGITKTMSWWQSWHQESGPSSLNYNTTWDRTGNTTDAIVLMNGISNISDQNAAGIMYLYYPSNTTYQKHFLVSANQYHATGISTNRIFVAGYFNTTSAINAFKFTTSSGNFSGKIKMYGII